MFLPFVLSFLLTALVTYPLLLILRQIKSVQSEREEGLDSHKKKSGTPTMGGIGFLIIISTLGLVFLPPNYYPLICLFAGFGAIGFFDDFIKILRKQNLGLTFSQKIMLQILAAVIFSIFIINARHLILMPPVLKFFYFDNYWLYLALSIFMIVGGANAANLTDGLDGLLAGAASISFICFGLVLVSQFYFEGAILAFVVAGALIGFLVYNFPRRGGALLFMGDAGSLPVGAVLSGLAVLTHNELMLILVAAVFIIEALSVIIQVAVYKIIKKRVFLMSPLHHHFEMLGWSEKSVVFSFWLVSLLLGLVGLYFSV